jgi:cytoskeletal protein CcmA (bactofilin family)
MMAKTDKNESQTKQTTVEEGTEFKGTLRSNCQVVVRGVVDGDLTAPSLMVSNTGTVVGNVKADCIRSEGVLAGRVDAEDVYLSGSVRSDTIIRARTLEVKLQRENGKLEVTFGECILDVGDDPRADVQDAPRAQAQEIVPPPRARRSVPPAAMDSADAAPHENGKHHGSIEGEPKTGRHSVPPPS